MEGRDWKGFRGECREEVVMDAIRRYWRGLRQSGRRWRSPCFDQGKELIDGVCGWGGGFLLNEEGFQSGS